jgi:hypothetical protein
MNNLLIISCRSRLRVIDADKLDLISRMAGGWYTWTIECVAMQSIRLEEWRRDTH